MKELNRNELLEINGGINVTGAVISAISKGINTILDFGRCLGTAIRRLGSGNVCPM